MHSDSPNPKLSGLILAGGRGQRMGGADKGLVLFRGRALLAHVLERLRPQVDEVLISANRNLATYAAFGHAVHADAFDAYPGPLAGLHAGLCHARHDWVLAVPCDLPMLPADLAVRLLHAALQTSGTEIAVARVAGRAQPVCCLCRRSLLHDLAAHLAAGGRKVDAWQRSRRRIEVDFDDQAAAFTNFNSPQDLEAAAADSAQALAPAPPGKTRK